jgi:hypothetical protein
MTKFSTFMGVFFLFLSLINSPLISYTMKVLKFALKIIKVAYFLVKAIGYQPFVDAWKKANE